MSKSGVIGRRTWLQSACALAVLGLAATLPGRTGAAPAGSRTPTIVGTWELNAPGAPTVRILQTYTADGTMVSVGDDHPSRGPQLGVWSAVGERQFLVRNVSLRFGPSGAVSHRIDTRVLFTVDPTGHTMTGRGERYEENAAGASVGPAINFEVKGTRIMPVPLAGGRTP